TRNAGGNLYFSTTTIQGTATTSISALEVSGSGFGTTTVRGLNISGQATSTSNVGFNLSGGCFAISSTCMSSSAASATYPINSIITSNGSGALIATGTQLTVGNLIATTSAS